MSDKSKSELTLELEYARKLLEIDREHLVMLYELLENYLYGSQAETAWELDAQYAKQRTDAELEYQQKRKDTTE